ncbi:CS1 type fimbrial major subunit [Photobacterium kagoshimensis]|uniref:CS1 type fimbrial major subunit n=1 Tax=Photobacterium kagoshimensis TaxID=2910242 RepID=UPI003D0FBAA5
MKKTTLALAALMALSCGSVSAAVEKKDYQLNFFAQVNNNFSFERLDGKSWSEAIDIKYSALRGEFEDRLVKTRVTLAGQDKSKPLKAALRDASNTLVNKADYTQVVNLTIAIGGVDLGTGYQTVAATAEDENVLDLMIKPDAVHAAAASKGDYEGKFAIQFEYEV